MLNLIWNNEEGWSIYQSSDGRYFLLDYNNEEINNGFDLELLKGEAYNV